MAGVLAGHRSALSASDQFLHQIDLSGVIDRVRGDAEHQVVLLGIANGDVLPDPSVATSSLNRRCSISRVSVI